MSADSAAAPRALGTSAVSGVIHDRGYRRYDGERLGRLQIVRALAWHSFRSAFGIGRGPKAKIVPVIAFVALCLPAVINTVGLARGGGPVVGYGTYTFALRVVVMIIFVAVAAPELVSRDLRSRVLPLYFSRPLRRGDYPLAKYAAFTLACLAMVEIPLLLLYLGALATHGGGVPVLTQTRELAGGLAVGLMWAVLLAAIGLAIASLSARRAYATGAVAIFFTITYTLAMIVSQVTGQAVRGPSAPAGVGERLSGLLSPFSLIDGIRQWLGGPHPEPGPIPSPGGYGVAYAVVFLVLLAASGTVLAVRYRRAESGMSTIELADVTRWYGNVVAVNDVTMTIGPGVTGLLGPNGAGKSTILHMMAGFLAPSRGTLTVGGEPAWCNPGIYRKIGLVPERDSVYATLTGTEFVRATARLHRLPEADAAAARAIAMVEMEPAADRRIATYSKGMRQRIKVAAALVHDPGVLLLDEPFNGMDPRQRLQMMDLLDKLGAEGRTILFSSHILEEVERLSGTIQVVVAGRLAASGDFRAIRRLMTSRPHVFGVRSSDDRRLAAALIGRPSVAGVELSEAGLQVRASDYGAFCREIAVLARGADIRLLELLPSDESLESVFAYLIAS